MAELEFGDVTVAGEPLDKEEVHEEVWEAVEAEEAPEPEVGQDSVSEADPDAELSEEEILDKYWPLPEGFPDKAQLDAWEADYGRIRIHRVAPHEAYVVRALSRPEFRKYLDILQAKFAGKKEVDQTELRMLQEELLVERCTLWPAITGADVRGETKNQDGSKRPIHKVGLAGTASILAFDIQEISNLVDMSVGPFEEL